MNIAQIEAKLQNLLKSFKKDTFIYDLLLAYNLPKASITRLKKGNLNLSEAEGEISWKKKLFFKEVQKEDLHLTISEISKELKHKQRFVIVTDYKTLLAIDTKTDEKLDIALKDLPKHFDFFLPWAGMEKAQHVDENPADVKAAEKMAKLFDEIKKDNPDDSPEFIHGLNVFLSRLLFCFFAEDTQIFEENQFTNALDSHTQTDGSDLHIYLDTLFTVLNTPKNERRTLSEVELPEYLNAFPYVNGSLFKEKHKSPIFTRRSRQAILNSGEQSWSGINPDIFGSMFQAVIGADQRGSLGQHYTSVPNIMKVIEPLFLNELYEEFEKAKAKQNPVKARHALSQLLNRIHKLKIFDPACGSGNFLIIAYKELRILEMKIFKELGGLPLSGIQLSQFYGIEIDDFAGEIAKLALWLAEHQMNLAFYKEFGRTNPTLPLKEAGKIVQGNATRLDWEVVCPKTNANAEPAEVYILGNPPYLGFSQQNAEQKIDIKIAFGIKLKVDYIACWFIKAANYISYSKGSYAFVSTKSICQGEQVPLIWPNIYELNLEIVFAHQNFHWSNNAKSKAAVIVVIVGISVKSNRQKTIYNNGLKTTGGNINPYLTSGKNIIIKRISKPISLLPKMTLGNSPFDGGHLIMTDEEKKDLIIEFPETEEYLRKIIGAAEFMKNSFRWCLWISDVQIESARKNPIIHKRIDSTFRMRVESKDAGTNKLAKRPHQFRDRNEAVNHSILIPRVGSSRREYLPCGFFQKDVLIGDSAQVVYDSEPYIFGLLSSQIHLSWVKAVSGYLKMDVRYSSVISYNTFPFPPISTQRKNEITQAVFRILEEREKHSDKTLAQLYDPDKMPEGLREAHRQNDLIIEKCYRSTPFKSDEERLEYLFKLYEKMIEEEKNRGTLFEEKKKTRKTRKTRK